MAESIRCRVSMKQAVSNQRRWSCSAEYRCHFFNGTFSPPFSVSCSFDVIIDFVNNNGSPIRTALKSLKFVLPCTITGCAHIVLFLATHTEILVNNKTKRWIQLSIHRADTKVFFKKKLARSQMAIQQQQDKTKCSKHLSNYRRGSHSHRPTDRQTNRQAWLRLLRLHWPRRHTTNARRSKASLNRITRHTFAFEWLLVCVRPTIECNQLQTQPANWWENKSSGVRHHSSKKYAN